MVYLLPFCKSNKDRASPDQAPWHRVTFRFFAIYCILKISFEKKYVYIILILTLTSSKASAKQIVFHFLLFWWIMANGCQKLLRYNSGFQDTKSSSLTHQSRRVLHLGRSQSHTHTQKAGITHTHTPIKINEKLGYFRDGVFMTAINNKRCPHNVDKGEWLH